MEQGALLMDIYGRKTSFIKASYKKSVLRLETKAYSQFLSI